jgi:8-oxo-dGTP diphosphatase / 2-hydroxy-dATP diphosphatase
MKTIQTVCIVYQHPKILLGMKKRGFGAGKWNGFGGKVKENESVFGAARRELYEESGITAGNLEEMGIVNFQFENNPEEILEVHFLKSAGFSGEPAETEEMIPRWFDTGEIPFDKMWPDDKFWLPLFLAGKKFRGNFLFGNGGEIIRHNLKVVEKL